MKRRLRLKAFTIIELLVSLTIFSLAMAAVIGIVTLGMKTLEKYSAENAEQTRALLIYKVLEGVIQFSTDITAKGSDSFQIASAEKDYLVKIEDKSLIIEEWKGFLFVRKRIFKTGEYSSMALSIVTAGGKKGLLFTMNKGPVQLERLFLAGYQRK